MMTIADFQALIKTYQAAMTHREWVVRHLDSFNFQTAQSPDAAFNAAMDQEKAALRDLLAGAKRLLDEATQGHPE